MSKISAAGVLCVIGVLNGMGTAAMAGSAVLGVQTTLNGKSASHTLDKYGDAVDVSFRWQPNHSEDGVWPVHIRAECTDQPPTSTIRYTIPKATTIKGALRVVWNTKQINPSGSIWSEYTAQMDNGVVRLRAEPQTNYVDTVTIKTAAARVTGCDKKYVNLWVGWDAKPTGAQIQNGNNASWTATNTTGPAYALMAVGAQDEILHYSVEAASNVTLDTPGQKLTLLRAGIDNPLPIDVVLSATDEIKRYTYVWYNGNNVTDETKIKLVPGGDLSISVEKLAPRFAAKGHVIATITSP